MGSGQMLLILLVIVLFSTLLIGTYNRLYMQSELVYKSMFAIQAQKVADRFLQQVDLEYFQYMNNSSSLTTLDNKYMAGVIDSLQTSDGTKYYVNISGRYCNLNGTNSASDIGYRRIDVTAYCVKPVNDTIWAGTSSNPLPKLIGDMGL